MRRHPRRILPPKLLKYSETPWIMQPLCFLVIFLWSWVADTIAPPIPELELNNFPPQITFYTLIALDIYSFNALWLAYKQLVIKAAYTPFIVLLPFLTLLIALLFAFKEHYGLGVFLMLVLAAITHSRFAPRNSIFTHIKGRAMSTTFQVQRAHLKHLPQGEEGLFWGGQYVSLQQAMCHFLFVGASGSGKTLNLRLWLQSALPLIKPGSNKRMLIFDAKRDILEVLHGIGVQVPIYNLNAFDIQSVAWDIATDITSYADAETLCDKFYPDDAKKEDAFFKSAAYQLTLGVIKFFINAAPSKWTLRDLVLTLSDMELAKKLLESDAQTKMHLNILGSGNTGSNVQATVATKIGKYAIIAALWDIAMQEGRVISLNDWQQGSSVLILGKSRQSKMALENLNQLIIAKLVELLDGTERKEPETFIVLDELPSISNCPELLDFAVEGRSKGVSLCLAFQSILGMEKVYGKEMSRTIAGQCRHKTFLKIDDKETAFWASDLIGESEQKYITFNGFGDSRHDEKDDNKNWNLQYRRVKTVMPSELQSLRPGIRGKIGVTGFYMGAYGLFKHCYSPRFIARNLSPTAQNVKNFEPTPPEWQRLRPWNQDDLKRLNITHLVNPKPSIEELVKGIHQGTEEE